MWLAHVTAWNFVGELTLKVYDKLQSLSLAWYSDKETGQIMSRTLNDTRNLEVLFAHALPDMFSNIVIIVLVCVMIILINPLLAAAYPAAAPYRACRQQSVLQKGGAAVPHQSAGAGGTQRRLAGRYLGNEGNTSFCTRKT